MSESEQLASCWTCTAYEPRSTRSATVAVLEVVTIDQHTRHEPEPAA